jgi:hypothetical protein
MCETRKNRSWQLCGIVHRFGGDSDGSSQRQVPPGKPVA